MYPPLRVPLVVLIRRTARAGILPLPEGRARAEQMRVREVGKLPVSLWSPGRGGRCLLQNSAQGLTKTIPGAPAGKTPIHEVKNPIFTGVQK